MGVNYVGWLSQEPRQHPWWQHVVRLAARAKGGVSPDRDTSHAPGESCASEGGLTPEVTGVHHHLVTPLP